MNQNNTVNQGVYKKIKAPKTVYDPSVISDEQMLQWGKKVNYMSLRGLRDEEEIPIVEQK